MNLNVLLLIFVILGVSYFQTIFIAEQAEAVEEPLPFQASLIEDITDSFIAPSINVTQIVDCDGFTDCVEAAARAALELIWAFVIIIYDAVLIIVLFIAIIIFPIPDAPAIVNVLFYTLKIGAIVVLIAILKPGGNG